MKSLFCIVSITSGILLLVGCGEKAAPFDIVSQTKQYATAIQAGNFDIVTENYDRYTADPASVDTALAKIHRFIKDETFPVDSLFWNDTAKVRIGEFPPAQALRCYFPMSPALLSPVPEGYFYFFYDLLSKKLIGFNYQSNRYPTEMPSFPSMSNLAFELSSIKSVTFMQDGGISNPTLLKRTELAIDQLADDPREQKVLELVKTLNNTPHTYQQSIVGNKKFNGSPAMYIISINMKSGEVFSLFNVIEEEAGKEEKHPDQIMVYHCKRLNSCYEYMIAKNSSPELISLMQELGESATPLPRSLPVPVIKVP